MVHYRIPSHVCKHIRPVNQPGRVSHGPAVHIRAVVAEREIIELYIRIPWFAGELMVGGWTGDAVALSEGQVFMGGHLGFRLVESVSAGAQVVVCEVGVGPVVGIARAV